MFLFYWATAGFISSTCSTEYLSSLQSRHNYFFLRAMPD